MTVLSAKAWNLENVSGVLFDKDGTLMDSHAYWGRIIERRSTAIVERYALSGEMFDPLCLSMGFDRSSGILRPEGPIALVSREEVIDVVLKFLASRGVNASGVVLSELFVREHEAFLAEIYDHIKILPGVKELLQHLKHNGVKSAVVTTDTVKNTEEILRFLELDHFFAAVIGKESTKEAKVTGVPALAALKQLDLQPQQVICIGDAPMDLIMAEKSSLKAGVGVATGQITLEVLLTYSPFCAASMEELKVE